MRLVAPHGGSACYRRAQSTSSGGQAVLVLGLNGLTSCAGAGSAAMVRCAVPVPLHMKSSIFKKLLCCPWAQVSAR